MLGNFTYSNPTRLHFWDQSLLALNEELPKYGKKVLLVYGTGSIKKTGLYDEVLDLLAKNDLSSLKHTCYFTWYCIYLLLYV